MSVSGQDAPLVGVLAVQGNVAEHAAMLTDVGARPVQVRRAEQLDGLHGLVIPGGESTTIGKLAEMYGLMGPLRKRIADGLPAFGTCAGAILLSRQALFPDGSPALQPLLGSMDTVVRRNAFGRQAASFEANLVVEGVDGGAMHGVFIRAPWFERVGPDVEVLATVATDHGHKIVVVRQRNMVAAAFHPELTGDARLHALFVDMVRRVD